MDSLDLARADAEAGSVESRAVGAAEAAAPDEAAAFRAAAESWGLVYAPPAEVTDEVRRKFAEAVSPTGRGLLARGWLGEHGLLRDPEPESGGANDSGATPASAPAPAAARKPAGPDAIPELPSNPPVELAVLGCMVNHPETVPDCVGALNEGDFTSAERAAVFRRIAALHRQGHAVNAVMIEAEMMATVPGLAARDLVGNVIRSATPPDGLPRCFELLKHYSVARAKILAAKELLKEARPSPANARGDSLVRARKLLERVEEATPDDDSPEAQIASWPEPIADVAYHGLAGEFVRLVAPRTEADPVAILGQFLISFGNLIGRKAHWSVDASRHYANEFLVVCGLTSRGRKGTSWDITKLLFERVDPAWVNQCHHSGVASGEVLIYTVRDPKFVSRSTKLDQASLMDDEGVSDKRALWVESEFQGVLAVMRRDGSTVSSWLRKAWESGTLENANKNSPLRATGAHISMIGHITFDELRRCLPATEVGNGFANRYLWLCSRRSRLLPRGGGMLARDFARLLDPLAERLRAAVKFADDDLFKEIEVGFSEAAGASYDAHYPRLSRTRVGRVSMVTDRAEAHVRRLALIYALLDQSPVVDLVHLDAALAFWDYCERSAQFVFGQDDEADPVAEKVFEAVRSAGEAGLTLNEVNRKLFGGRCADEVREAISALARACLIKPVTRQTRRRPVTAWVAPQ